jgi:hypothetical protein
VKAQTPFQVCRGGVMYLPGKTADVPDHIAAVWLREGWVKQVGASSRTAKGEGVSPRPAPPPGGTAPADQSGNILER